MFDNILGIVNNVTKMISDAMDPAKKKLALEVKKKQTLNALQQELFINDGKLQNALYMNKLEMVEKYQIIRDELILKIEKIRKDIQI